jgi:hypothetical protein
MTFDPQHDYESMASAKLRLGGKLQEDCGCQACVAAGVGQGEDGKLLLRETHKIDGRWEVKGRWHHGFELKATLAKRRELFEGMKRTLVSHGMVER